MIELIVSEGPASPELEEWLGEELDRDTAEKHIVAYCEKPLSIIACDQEGRRLGALVGKIHWDWLYIDMIWLDASQRGQGIGSALNDRAEKEALRRGCVGVYLWTQSFQAPGFYEKLGFQPFTVFSDFPKGHERIGYRKKLVA